MESPTPFPKSNRRFFPELESARGVAALLVAGFHCSQSPVLVAGVSGQLRDPCENGSWRLLQSFFDVLVPGSGFPHHGVLFFFVLSGFVLTDSLRNGPRSMGRASGRFFMARFFRIYPAVVATILLFWAAHSILRLSLDPEGYSLRSLLLNFSLLRVNIDGVIWTVQVEILALPLIFGAFFLYSRGKIAWIAAIALILTALAFWGGWSRLLTDFPSRTKWLFVFFYGILGYHLGRRVFRKMKPETATAIFLTSVAIFFLLGTIIHNVWETIFEAIVAGVMIGVLAFGPKIAAAAPLRTRPLRFLGRVSYSFYLLHPLALAVIWNQPERFGSWVERGVPGFLIAMMLWLVTTVAILPLAWVMYRTVERPFIRLGRHWWERAFE